jgi:hypothetical protein
LDEFAARSPTLSACLREILDDGWTIRYDPDVGGGAYSNRQRREILIDPNSDPEQAVVSVAHEIGHARRAAYRPRPILYEGQPREVWVRESVFEHLKDEGDAALTEAQILREINNAGGPELRVSGKYGPQYEEIYDRYARGELTRDEARHEAARWYSAELRSGGSAETYRDHYEAVCEREFSESLAPFERKYRSDQEGTS